MDKRQPAAALGLLLVTIIWGSTFIFVKWTVESLDVYYFLFLRFLAASVSMVAVFHRRLRSIDAATVKAGVVVGLFLAVTFIAQTEGLRYTTASNSALITGLYMVLVPIFSFFYTREKTGALSIAGIALAVPGSFLLTRYSYGGINIGDIITAVVPISCAWHIIMTGVYTKRYRLIPLVTVQFVFTAIVCGAVSLAKGTVTANIPLVAWATLAVTAMFASCLAFTIQTYAQRIIDPSRVGIIFAMEAVFGALFGWWLGGETMTATAFAGACLMVSGMVVSEIRPVVRGLIDKIAG